MPRERIVGRVLGWRRMTVQHIDGRDWMLHQDADDPLRFVAVPSGKTLTPPDKYIHDWGSIPWLAQGLLGGPAGQPEWAQFAGRAYILHDWAYEWQHWDSGEPMTRLQADQLMAAALEDLHCAEWYVWTVYHAVRVGGGPYWRRHKEVGRCSQYGNG